MILQQSSSSPSYSECFLPFLEAGGEVTGEMISAGTGEYFFLGIVPFMKLIETPS
jgi:hypothetical protein